MAEPLETLTDKEKETLRLIVRGHDAKSAASVLGLSVHTINERLRSTRRKLDVTSSREAARLLLECERAAPEPTPEKFAHKPLGDASGPAAFHPSSVTAPASRRVLWIGGIAMLTAFALALALTLSGPTPPAESQTSHEIAAADAEREAAARQWLELVDASNWEASYQSAGTMFREPNTVASWQAASEQARTPLGAVISREAIGFQIVPSPEQYEVVRFQTDFENQQGVVESVTLMREDGVLKVVGYYLN